MKGKVQRGRCWSSASARRGMGSNVTLCINDANLCLGKCVCMTQRKFEEVYIIPRRSSYWISWKSTCFTQELPHMGIYYVDSVSASHEQITCLLTSILEHFQSVLYTAVRMIFLKNKCGCCSSSSIHVNILTLPSLCRVKKNSNKVLLHLQGPARWVF